jgi:vacuolar protein sorting-associated protein 13A/C
MLSHLQFVMEVFLTNYSRSILVQILQRESPPLHLLTSNEDIPDRDLMTITYLSTQRSSPEFATRFQSIDQDIHCNISTVIFRLAPEPLIALYDFMMAAFVRNDSLYPEGVAKTASAPQGPENPKPDSVQFISVSLALESVSGTLFDYIHKLH